MLQKQCKCGQEMEIRLRSVIYQNRVEMEYVPVFTCQSCNRSEVFPAVKPDLTKLIGALGNRPEKQKIRFDEISELAHLIRVVTDKGHRQEPVEAILEERINELLDMLLLARSLGDQNWLDDVMDRLSRITQFAANVYEFKS